LIKADRLSTSDIRSLIKLLGRTFNPGQIASGMVQKLNPLAA